MSMEYIRNYYRVPAKRGGRVRSTYWKKDGTIKGTDGAYLRILFDGESEVGTYHPTWELVYLTNAASRQ